MMGTFSIRRRYRKGIKLNSGVTWNPADLNNTTLSNGNLTAAPILTAPAGGVRSTTSHTGGKFYLEAQIDIAPGDYSGGVGFSPVTRDLSDPNLYFTPSTLRINGGIWTADGTINLYSVPQGERVGFIVDFDNDRIWIACSAAGDWNAWGILNGITSDYASIVFPAFYTDLGYTGGYDATTAKFIYMTTIGTTAGGNYLGVTLVTKHSQCLNPHLSTIQGYGYGEW
jgi:hypothetical protein